MSVKRGHGAGDARPGLADYVNKALQPGADWPDKDDLLDVVYWGKQVFSLALGVLFGLLNLQGILALLAYVAISSVGSQQYVLKYQKVDDSELGGFWELAKEGFGAAFATFMVSWITVYTTFHTSA